MNKFIKCLPGYSGQKVYVLLCPKTPYTSLNPFRKADKQVLIAYCLKYAIGPDGNQLRKKWTATLSDL